MTSDRAKRPSRFGARLSALFKLSASATLLISACLVLSGGLACAEEEFACCECFFPQCIDPMGSGAAQRVCDCSTSYTFEACGLFCEQTAPANLFNQGFTNCGTASSSLAKDSCSIGNPVGAN
jgi:hypothetical protein